LRRSSRSPGWYAEASSTTTFVDPGAMGSITRWMVEALSSDQRKVAVPMPPAASISTRYNRFAAPV
jgi:hypothetical protein